MTNPAELAENIGDRFVVLDALATRAAGDPAVDQSRATLAEVLDWQGVKLTTHTGRALVVGMILALSLLEHDPDPDQLAQILSMSNAALAT